MAYMQARLLLYFAATGMRATSYMHEYIHGVPRSPKHESSYAIAVLHYSAE